MLDMMNHQEWNSYSYSNSSSLVDVSSFLLFESTGDSEFDSNICSTSDDHSLIPSHQRFLEDDDAQSCSYDEDMELDFKVENDDDDEDDDDDDDDDGNDGDVDTNSRCCSGFPRKSIGCWNSNMEDEEQDERGVVEQRWMNNEVNRCNEKLKSNVCSSAVVDSELKSQKDKDKLFWETCLAS